MDFTFFLLHETFNCELLARRLAVRRNNESTCKKFHDGFREIGIAQQQHPIDSPVDVFFYLKPDRLLARNRLSDATNQKANPCQDEGKQTRKQV